MPIEPTTDDEEPCVATTPSSFAEALAGVRPEIKSSNGRRVREKKEKCVTHVCITCRMGFASFSNLKTHLRVHKPMFFPGSKRVRYICHGRGRGGSRGVWNGG